MINLGELETRMEVVEESYLSLHNTLMTNLQLIQQSFTRLDRVEEVMQSNVDALEQKDTELETRVGAAEARLNTFEQANSNPSGPNDGDNDELK